MTCNECKLKDAHVASLIEERDKLKVVVADLLRAEHEVKLPIEQYGGYIKTKFRCVVKDVGDEAHQILANRKLFVNGINAMKPAPAPVRPGSIVYDQILANRKLFVNGINAMKPAPAPVRPGSIVYGRQFESDVNPEVPATEPLASEYFWSAYRDASLKSDYDTIADFEIRKCLPREAPVHDGTVPMQDGWVRDQAKLANLVGITVDGRYGPFEKYPRYSV